MPTPFRLANIKSSEGSWIDGNESADLWKLGDGIACLELKTKANTLDDKVLDLIKNAIERGKKGEFKGLVIGGDGDKFSSGANLELLGQLAQKQDWQTIESNIRRGQDILLEMKYAPFPVVSAVAGAAVGGGCELLLHSSAVQSLPDAKVGLVEAGVGLIPGWGGCTQMLLRHHGNSAAVFGLISKVKIARSAKEAMKLKFMRPETDGISTDGSGVARQLLLADAKQRCLDLIAAGYTPPEKRTVRLPGENGAIPRDKMLALGILVNQVTDYDKVVWKALADVLRGGKEGAEFTEGQLHALERNAFMELIKNPETQKRIGNYLAHKPVKESGGGLAHRVIASVEYLRGC